jgi:sensory rhodopsin
MAEAKKMGIYRGWCVSTIYCVTVLTAYPFVMAIFLSVVKSDPAALMDTEDIGGPLPYRQWEFVQAAFLVCLTLDFISWLWTVDEDKSRLFLFVIVINGLPAISYGLLAAGIGPVVLDVRGKRLMIMRYVHWLFTTPAMLYVYSLVSSLGWKELTMAMCMEFVCIVSGYFASVLPQPFDLVALTISCTCFYFVIAALDKMLTLAIDESSPDPGGSSYRQALCGARVFIISTWIAMPTVWFLAYFGAISFLVEETMYELLDFTTKAGISSLILHSSIKTYAQKQASSPLDHPQCPSSPPCPSRLIPLQLRER